MTDSISNLTTGFDRAIHQIESQRSFVGAFFGSDKDKHVRFSAKKGLYLHRGFSGKGDKAAIDRAKKRADGAKAVFKTLENSLGTERAQKIFSKWASRTGKNNLEGGMTLGDLKQLRNLVKQEVNPPSNKSVSAPAQSLQDSAMQSAPVSRFTLDGQVHQSTGSAQFNDQLQRNMAESLKKDLNRPEKFGDHSDVHVNMAKDFGRTHITVNGNQVSGNPKDVDMSPEDQIKNCSQLFTNAGLPEWDKKVLSTALHQGVFADLQNTAYAAGSDAPLPGNLSLERSGLTTRITAVPDQPGSYKFHVESSGDLTAIMEFPEKGKSPQPPHIMESGARGSFSVTGVIHVGDPSTDPQVEVEDVSASYQGVAK